MPNTKYFRRLDALKQNGPPSLQVMIEALTEFEGLDNEEAQKVCRDWLKKLSTEWAHPDVFGDDRSPS